MTDCNTDVIGLGRQGRRRIEADFKGGRLVSDGGLPASRADHGALPPTFRSAFGGGFRLNDDDHRDAIRAYLACVSFLDEQVGRVLDALDASGQADDTVVVLTADHGFLLGEHGLWFKKYLYEPSCRVPLIIADPRRPAAHGHHHADPVELLDLYPTLSELLGTDPPAGLEGVSLAGSIDDPRADTGRAAVTTVKLDGHPGASVRTRRYRYTRWADDALPPELYDHDSDPAERQNLARAAVASASLDLAPLDARLGAALDRLTSKRSGSRPRQTASR